MIIRRYIFSAAAAALSAVTMSGHMPPYKNPTLPVEERVEDLLNRMTGREKIMQLTQYAFFHNNNANNVEKERIKEYPAEIGSLIICDLDVKMRNEMQRKAMEESRLGIPVLFGYDVIHGFRTIYPISLAQACSWNPDLAGKACHMAAVEAKSIGIDWTFSPMIDVARDPRWGRVAEGYGEDPYTNSVFAMASVKGYQGDDMSAPDRIAACLKHYVAYGASEAGRDYVYTEVSDQTLWDTYLPPYLAGVEAGAATVMSSFNDINGIPGSANHHTLTDILKVKWGFDGFVVSDWGSVEQLINQGYANDLADAARLALNSGVDMDMGSHAYDRHIDSLINAGAIDRIRLDDAVRRILRVKLRLGIFEHPYATETNPKDVFLTPSNRAIARRMAEESMVLLKNRSSILPLGKGFNNIAVIGPMAMNGADLLGSWHGHGLGKETLPIADAVKQEFNWQSVRYAPGCGMTGDSRSSFAEALEIASNSDVIILCLGEKNEWSGENAPSATISLPAIQEELAMELSKTGKPIVLLLTNGRPLDLSRIEPICDAILEMWQPGTEGATAAAAILSGKVNPSGKLAITFPRSVGQIPIYYNRRKRARHDQGFYLDHPSDPLYPFGHGLSYTDFKYGDISASSTAVTPDQKLSLEVTVHNTGSIDGEETVMWFVNDPVSSITRPEKELKFFEKQNIPAGKSRVYRFEVDIMRDLGYIDAQGNRFVEKGEYEIMVGNQTIKITLK